ncbi:TolA Membrane protein [Pyrenophora teres f. maculata]|nr:TolA Membrane protein [Pyrenophora teres f. maculata]
MKATMPEQQRQRLRRLVAERAFQDHMQQLEWSPHQQNEQLWGLAVQQPSELAVQQRQQRYETSPQQHQQQALCRVRNGVSHQRQQVVGQQWQQKRAPQLQLQNMVGWQQSQHAVQSQQQRQDGLMQNRMCQVQNMQQRTDSMSPASTYPNNASTYTSPQPVPRPLNKFVSIDPRVSIFQDTGFNNNGSSYQQQRAVGVLNHAPLRQTLLDRGSQAAFISEVQQNHHHQQQQQRQQQHQRGLPSVRPVQASSSSTGQTRRGVSSPTVQRGRPLSTPNGRKRQATSAPDEAGPTGKRRIPPSITSTYSPTGYFGAPKLVPPQKEAERANSDCLGREFDLRKVAKMEAKQKLEEEQRKKAQQEEADKSQKILAELAEARVKAKKLHIEAERCKQAHQDQQKKARQEAEKERKDAEYRLEPTQVLQREKDDKRREELRKDPSANYRHILEVYRLWPLKGGWGQRNTYLTGLLANKCMPVDKNSELGLAIKYAKDHWEYYGEFPRDTARFAEYERERRRKAEKKD